MKLLAEPLIWEVTSVMVLSHLILEVIRLVPFTEKAKKNALHLVLEHPEYFKVCEELGQEFTVLDSVISPWEEFCQLYGHKCTRVVMLDNIHFV